MINPSVSAFRPTLWGHWWVFTWSTSACWIRCRYRPCIGSFSKVSLSPYLLAFLLLLFAYSLKVAVSFAWSCSLSSGLNLLLCFETSVFFTSIIKEKHPVVGCWQMDSYCNGFLLQWIPIAMDSYCSSLKIHMVSDDGSYSKLIVNKFSCPFSLCLTNSSWWCWSWTWRQVWSINSLLRFDLLSLVVFGCSICTLL